MKILALCGSLRKESRSLALLEATQILASDKFDFFIFKGAGDLPLFNPDIEDTAPVSVHTLWHAVSNSDVVIICSPEYAHGITGVLKNALDWLVGYIPFAYKPVAVFNPSHRAHHADDSLQEILTTMTAHLIPGACLRIPVTGCSLSAVEVSRKKEFSDAIYAALASIEIFCDRDAKRNANN
jgi:NAD(P)H-dependent FMN reductase